MKTLVTACIILAACTASAGDYSCYRSAAPFLSVPEDRPSIVTLEARRVAAITGDTLTYNLGARTIRIEADSAASRRFLRDVRQGRCGASERITLEPVRKSPFNDHYKARPVRH
ncbi:MAG: hypothetical protein WCX84_06460 [Syntrophales bacterium]|jgi:hypothetical protein|nr:hypothetical protein [Syntrophales bacterium]